MLVLIAIFVVVVGAWCGSAFRAIQVITAALPMLISRLQLNAAASSGDAVIHTDVTNQSPMQSTTDQQNRVGQGRAHAHRRPVRAVICCLFVSFFFFLLFFLSKNKLEYHTYEYLCTYTCRIFFFFTVAKYSALVFFILTFCFRVAASHSDASRLTVGLPPNRAAFPIGLWLPLGLAPRPTKIAQSGFYHDLRRGVLPMLFLQYLLAVTIGCRRRQPAGAG